MTHAWIRPWHTFPSPDELVLVALYRDDKLSSYVLAYFRDGEWVSDCSQYSWPANPHVAHLHSGVAGLLWRYFDAAPETAEGLYAKLGRVA